MDIEEGQSPGLFATVVMIDMIIIIVDGYGLQLYGFPVRFVASKPNQRLSRYELLEDEREGDSDYTVDDVATWAGLP